MLDDDLRKARRWFAEELRFVVRIEDQNVVDAFAAAPRERFVGPGPLRMLSLWNLIQRLSATVWAWRRKFSLLGKRVVRVSRGSATRLWA
jgi:protein-L-isoaspartate O-methyltransferase